ncbi:MAG: hypothetical protein ACRDTZ_04680 [Pseudonocardiaceae bacterium]
MTTSRYDSASPSYAGPIPAYTDSSEQPAEVDSVPPPAADTLELLRDAAEEVAAEVAAALHLVDLDSPGGKIRLRCDPSISQEQINKARDAATPLALRKKPLHKRLDKVRQQDLFVRLIRETAREILVRNGSDHYTRVVDHQGNPRDFTDPELLRMFGVADPDAAVRKIMGDWDAHILARGNDLMDAAGYSEDGPDTADPR